ncbi:MAG: NFYB/HAP3 family transcription factor subunit [Clostridiales Family XIII bacterium]|nr:NFYB/HAP3 family transcription factor subunit [Clostridiales Family XIII bacterium]
MKNDETLDNRKDDKEIETEDKVNLPLSVIRRIMKKDEEVNTIRKDALILVAKFTELFIHRLSDEAFQAAQADGRKTILPKDIQSAVHLNDEFDFLTLIIPYPNEPKQKAKSKKASAKENIDEVHVSAKSRGRKKKEVERNESKVDEVRENVKEMQIETETESGIEKSKNEGIVIESDDFRFDNIEQVNEGASTIRNESEVFMFEGEV